MLYNVAAPCGPHGIFDSCAFDLDSESSGYSSSPLGVKLGKPTNLHCRGERIKARRVALHSEIPSFITNHRGQIDPSARAKQHIKARLLTDGCGTTFATHMQCGEAMSLETASIELSFGPIMVDRLSEFGQTHVTLP